MFQDLDFELLGYKVFDGKVVNYRGDVVAQVDPYGLLDTKDDEVRAIVEKGPIKAPVTEKKVTRGKKSN